MRGDAHLERIRQPSVDHVNALVDPNPSRQLSHSKSSSEHCGKSRAVRRTEEQRPYKYDVELRTTRIVSKNWKTRVLVHDPLKALQRQVCDGARARLSGDGEETTDA